MNTQKIKLVFASAVFFVALCSPASSFGVKVRPEDVEYACRAVGKYTRYFDESKNNQSRNNYLETVAIRINTDRPLKEIASLLECGDNKRNDDDIIKEFIKIARDRREEIDGKTKQSSQFQYDDSQFAEFKAQSSQITQLSSLYKKLNHLPTNLNFTAGDITLSNSGTLITQPKDCSLDHTLEGNTGNIPLHSKTNTNDQRETSEESGGWFSTTMKLVKSLFN
ncbi:hypothetical protein [Candidatus Hydrogenosomobacter endosymbioticus]|uniref:Uncharacterized protein n=1 Tax=Candidatus Hydrogenosomobacter endosymbioticus TaxID=2558174 RepID=A0ABM7V8R9_9PROT|nr:hypothetical protein [Candidatus Hydrogenosomobacter endosymbioticus]BDB96163.1 hypothetical protein HYD_2960 [Candidatus Hydrogenosomobacter endosymbioticus]